MSDRGCLHCGQPAPENADFCCPGCRAVYEMLDAQGLGDFYRMRDRFGGERPAGPIDGEALAESASAYAHYDEPEFQTRYAPDGQRCTLYLDGVHCAACVWVMDQLPRVMPGVRASRLEFATQRLHLEWDPAATSLSAIGGMLHQLGYPSHPLNEADAAERRRKRSDLLRLAISFAAAGNTMLLAAALYAGELQDMSPKFTEYFEWWSAILTIPSVTYGSMPFYRGAWGGLRTRTAHIDVPISLGIIGGYVASVFSVIYGFGAVYFDTVGLLVFLLLLGRFFQQRGQRAALRGTELLAVLTPPIAWRLDPNAADGPRFRAVASSRLRPGDQLRVRAGETMPADGTVVRGQSFVDLSFLTGESRPLPVGEGGRAFAGSMNVADELWIRVEAAGSETRVGRMVAFAERADAVRAPLLRAVDRISGWFVGLVLLLAVVGGVAWWFIDPTKVFNVVVGLLVVSCPCALGLATPVALSVGRGRAAAAGTLIRSTAALERLARVRRVVLDKTGTLTEGRLSVVTAHVPPELRPVLGALESRSGHPIARAVATWGAEGAADVTLTAVEELASRGIAATVDGRRVAIGSGAHLGRGTFEVEMHAAAERGETPLAVAVEGVVVGYLTLGDKLREDTSAALERLRALGLELALRSGDDPAVVRAVADRLGVPDARGEVSPEAKAAEFETTPLSAMVGDGVNDAPALRAADVGIAVAGGAEAALGVADAYMTHRGLMPVVELFEGARRTMRVVRRNLWFSLAYNVLFATLALTGHISPFVAAVIMPLSGLTVLASSVFSRHHAVPEGRSAVVDGARLAEEAERAEAMARAATGALRRPAG
jgi:Cu2+-exporting ATPase